MAAKLVLITGASSGIGEALAKRYGRAGAHVLLLARNAERLGAVADAVRESGGTATIYPIDLADDKVIEDTSARIAREVGIPDVLINNAGAGRWLPLLKTTAKEALAMIEVPYLAAFNLTRAFLPYMLTRGSGTIACVTSPASYVVWPNANAYIAARQALKGFTDALRSEVRGTGVTVTLAVLGPVETPYWEHNPGSREHLPEVKSAARADAHRGRGGRGDLRRRGAPQTDRGEARHLARALSAQRIGARPRHPPASPQHSQAAGLTYSSRTYAQPCPSASTANRRAPRQWR